MILERTAGLLRCLYGGDVKGITIEKIIFGVFFSGVKLSDGSAGVAYTPMADLHDVACYSSMGTDLPVPVAMKGLSVHHILNHTGVSMLDRLVRLLVMNALSARFITPDRYRIIRDGDALDMINLREAGRIAMVGAFVPFLRRLKGVPGINLCVLERKRDSLKADELRFYVPAERAREVIPFCDTVIITGASIANDSIDELLSMARPETEVIVTGPTASLLPDVLFENNVSLVSGVQVTDPDLALDILAEGGTAYRLFNTSVRRTNVVRELKDWRHGDRRGPIDKRIVPYPVRPSGLHGKTRSAGNDSQEFS